MADEGPIVTREWGSFRKGFYIMLEARPCKVVDVINSTSGSDIPRYTIVGIDVFTGARYEDTNTSNYLAEAPRVSKSDFTLISLDDDGRVTVMAEDGDLHQVALPSGTADADGLAEQIKNSFGGEQDHVVTILKTLGEEVIVAVKAPQ